MNNFNNSMWSIYDTRPTNTKAEFAEILKKYTTVVYTIIVIKKWCQNYPMTCYNLVLVFQLELR